MPLALIAFLGEGIEQLVRSAGHRGADGADYAVPGFTVMFAFYMVGTLGFGFINEHGWRTWDRLRIAPASPAAIMLGKLLPYGAASIIQFSLLFAVGWLLLGMSAPSSLPALVALVIAVIAVVLSLAMFLVAVCRTAQQVIAISNVINIVFAAIGGSLLPRDSLASWIRSASPVTPHYWAVRGFDDILTGSGRLTDVVPEIGVLLAMASVLVLLTVRRFRVDAPKLVL